MLERAPPPTLRATSPSGGGKEAHESATPMARQASHLSRKATPGGGSPAKPGGGRGTLRVPCELLRNSSAQCSCAAAAYQLRPLRATSPSGGGHEPQQLEDGSVAPIAKRHTRKGRRRTADEVGLVHVRKRLGVGPAGGGVGVVVAGFVQVAGFQGTEAGLDVGGGFIECQGSLTEQLSHASVIELE